MATRTISAGFLALVMTAAAHAQPEPRPGCGTNGPCQGGTPPGGETTVIAEGRGTGTGTGGSNIFDWFAPNLTWNNPGAPDVVPEHLGDLGAVQCHDTTREVMGRSDSHNVFVIGEQDGRFTMNDSSKPNNSCFTINNLGNVGVAAAQQGDTANTSRIIDLLAAQLPATTNDNSNADNRGVLAGAFRDGLTMTCPEDSPREGEHQITFENARNLGIVDENGGLIPDAYADYRGGFCYPG